MPLTDAMLRNAKPAATGYSLNDGSGLSLYVTERGYRQWHFRCSYDGKRIRLYFGTYPTVSLKQARQRRDEARAQLAQGNDPRHQTRQQRQQQVMAKTDTRFATVARQWHEFRARKLTPGRKGSSGQSWRYLEKDLFPVLGKLPVESITRLDALNAVRRIEKRGALVSAAKCRTWLRHIFRFAMAQGMIENNPAADLDVIAELPPPVRHHPHLQLDELPFFLRRLRGFTGSPVTALATRFLLLTGVRIGELRAATVEQFDLERALWLIPPENVKQLRNRVRNQREKIPPYTVPLSRQALQIVIHLIERKTRGQCYLVPHRSEPRQMMSSNVVNNAIKRMGYAGDLTGHGLRGTLSTALNELGFKSEWIEAQLSHTDRNQIRAAYNHARYVEQRRVMMQYWADLLDALEHGSPIPERPEKELSALSVFGVVGLSGVLGETGRAMA